MVMSAMPPSTLYCAMALSWTKLNQLELLIGGYASEVVVRAVGAFRSRVRGARPRQHPLTGKVTQLQ